MFSETQLFMVFDVESIGLHGEGFAVGWVVIDRLGNKYTERYIACDPLFARGTYQDSIWVRENIPKLIPFAKSPREVRDTFWIDYLKWKEKGVVLVADCNWPVETNFISACIQDYFTVRSKEGPYPFLDLGSILFAKGKDPIATYDRTKDELPKHHPLKDAQQSARLLIEALNLSSPSG
jgi:hypothetical protein